MYKLTYLLAASAAATLCGAIAVLPAAGPRDLEPSPSQQLTPRHAHDSENWKGFLDNNCWDVRFYLSDEDMDRPDPAVREPYINSPVLSARCLDIQGKEVCTSLNLGECFWNDDAVLKLGDGGHFHESCSQCMIIDGKLRCYCKMDIAEGGWRGIWLWRASEIDLNAYINNFDGRMTCDWQQRSTLSDCPKEDSFDPDVEWHWKGTVASDV